jgi:O-antigen ligase
MRKLFFINDTKENVISYYLLAFFLIALPFDHFYSEIILICFTIHTLIHFRKKNIAFLKNKEVWLIASIFFINVLGILYSNYYSEGYKDAVHQMGILLFPACLALTGPNLYKYKIPLLKIFGFTCTITILYLYFESFRTIHYFNLPYSSILMPAFLNHNFSAPIELHATYLSMYVALSISIFIYLFFKQPGLKSATYIFCCVVLLTGLIQLSSRSVFISICVILIVGIPALLIQSKKKIYFFFIALLASLLIIAAITDVGSLKKRYFTDLENDLTENAKTVDNSETRMKRWDMEFGIIQKFPLIGYGSGSEKYILTDKYFENKFYRSYLLQLNSHDQYLSFWLKTGIIGLLLYLYILYYGFASAIKSKDFLLLSFMIILCIVSISENILDVNKGVFFYSFFFSLFLLSNSQEKGKAIK